MLNKNDFLQPREFSYTFLKEDEISDCKKKICYLKDNSLTITIKNVNQDRKMYDNKFYIGKQ